MLKIQFKYHLHVNECQLLKFKAKYVSLNTKFFTLVFNCKNFHKIKKSNSFLEQKKMITK